MKNLMINIIDALMKFSIFRKLILVMNWELTKYNGVFICKMISPEKNVLSGLFKGMIYPDFKSAGSALIPKIVGSYEDELKEVFMRLLNNSYTEVIDVGCAEGYYAIGIALKQKKAKVYAYDIDPEAIELCHKMALANKVLNIEIGKSMDSNTLENFKFSGKSLLIIDVEGYESKLLNNSSCKNLNNCDIVIEFHEESGVDERYFIDLFKDTHAYKMVYSRLKHIDDYNQLFKLPNELKSDLILLERTRKMKWLIFETNKKHN